MKRPVVGMQQTASSPGVFRRSGRAWSALVLFGALLALPLLGPRTTRLLFNLSAAGGRSPWPNPLASPHGSGHVCHEAE
jgi:hypothetical protein